MSDLQQKSIIELRKRGYLVGSVERRKRFPARGKTACRACGLLQMIDIASDLFNCFDLLGARNSGTHKRILIQVTSAANHSTRRNKILASGEAKICLLSGYDLLIQSWRKKDNRWQAADEWISIEQFAYGLPDSVEELYEIQRKEKLPDLPTGSSFKFNPVQDSEVPF